MGDVSGFKLYISLMTQLSLEVNSMKKRKYLIKVNTEITDDLSEKLLLRFRDILELVCVPEVIEVSEE